MIEFFKTETVRVRFLDMEMVRKLSFLVVLLSVLISLKNPNAETKNGSDPSSFPPSISFPPQSSSQVPTGSPRVPEEEDGAPRSLEYDYYRRSCPDAEKIIRETVRRIHAARPDIAPSLLRLVFHDCFIEGCDASVLLDTIDGAESEKEALPNETLKGFDVVDTIKSEVEEVCPGIVSCADILVLAGRESVVLVGGPFYPLLTGRRDSNVTFAEIAAHELPSPEDDLPSTIAAFASRGFDERETVTLLGAHSVGVIHCKFFNNRLYNFHGTYEPDPSVNAEFLNLMRSVCNDSKITSTSPPSSFSYPSPSPSPLSSPSSSSSPSQSESPEPFHLDLSPSLAKNSGMKMDYEGPGERFGSLYYRSLLQNRGILYVDQQLTAMDETRNWVRAYASDTSLFRQDFAVTMMKLSNLSVLTAPHGHIRLHCARVN